MDTTRHPSTRIHFGVRVGCVLGAAFCIHLALSVNLVGDWLRDALNPKLQ